MFEVELKIKVDSFEEIENKVSSMALFEGSFCKSDIYYKKVGTDEALFRIRKTELEKSSVSPWTVTYKEKKIEDSVEINKETEFDVSDKESFESFVFSLGYCIDITKVKKGKSWKLTFQNHSFHIETASIEKLGNYIEIETLVELTSDLPKAKNALLCLIDTLDLSKYPIEDRYYIDMLRALS